MTDSDDRRLVKEARLWGNSSLRRLSDYERVSPSYDILADRLDAALDREGALKAERAGWIELARQQGERAQQAEAELKRLRAELGDYLLWEPGRASHAAAHHRLAAVLRGPSGDAENKEQG